MPEIVLSVDMDGTLLDEHENIHPEDCQLLLNNSLPVQIIIATGRSIEGVRYVLDKNGLFEGQVLPFPMVLQNGAFLYHPDEVLKASFPFAGQVMVDLRAMVDRHPEIMFLWQGIDRTYFQWPTEFGMNSAIKYGFTPIPLADAQPDELFGKIMAISNRMEELQVIEADAKNLSVEATYSLGIIYEMTVRGVSKGSGLRTLLPSLGMADAVLYAVGDGDNDTDMFKEADYAYTPLNGSAAAKAHADQIIDKRPHGVLRPILEQIMQRESLVMDLPELAEKR